MTRPVIISCAVTGGADNAQMNPAIPVTPEQLAAELTRVAELVRLSSAFVD